jgi:hypothetical protein
MTPQNFQSVYWAPLFASKVLAYRNVHVLRHTYASLLIQNGESPKYIQEQLGHSSIKITMDIYGHLIHGSNKLAVDRLDDPTGAKSASYPQVSPGTRRAMRPIRQENTLENQVLLRQT